MKGRHYFISDAHLGARSHANPLEVEQRLVRFLDSIADDAAAIWMLGDIFDYWFEYRYVVPKGFVRFLGKLATLADRGVEIHFLVGNHDIWMFDYLEKEIGATVHHDPVEVDLLGRRFYLAHGDGADDRSRVFHFLRWLFRNKVCQRLYAAIHPRWSGGFALSWSQHSREKGNEALEEQEYQGESGEYLVRFVKQYSEQNPDIDYYLFGHRHIMLDLMVSRKVRMMILGDWIQLYSYAVWDGEAMMLMQFEEE